MTKAGIYIASVATLFSVAAVQAMDDKRQATLSEVKTACAGDALQVCSPTDLTRYLKGDHSGITTCFKQRHDKLSETCREVLKRHPMN